MIFGGFVGDFWGVGFLWVIFWGVLQVNRETCFFAFRPLLFEVCRFFAPCKIRKPLHKQWLEDS